MSPTCKPAVSVVLPVYNGADTLSRAVDSVRAQDCRDWELIIVDDGSTDGSGEIADRLARADGRILVLHGPHRGLVPALADGCAAARG